MYTFPNIAISIIPLKWYRWPTCKGLAHDLSREMYQTVSIDWEHLLSRVRVSIRPSYFVYATKTPKRALKPCRRRECIFQWTSDRPRKGAVPSSRLVASYTPNSDNLNGDNCGHSGDSLTQNGERETSQNGYNENLYIDYYSVCVMCLKYTIMLFDMGW